jgi:hypothetical protein
LSYRCDTHMLSPINTVVMWESQVLNQSTLRKGHKFNRAYGVPQLHARGSRSRFYICVKVAEYKYKQLQSRTSKEISRERDDESDGSKELNGESGSTRMLKGYFVFYFILFYFFGFFHYVLFLGRP